MGNWTKAVEAMPCSFHPAFKKNAGQQHNDSFTILKAFPCGENVKFVLRVAVQDSLRVLKSTGFIPSGV